MSLLCRLLLVFASLARSAVSITTDSDLSTAPKMTSFDPSLRINSVADHSAGKRFLRVHGEGGSPDVAPKNVEERGSPVSMAANAAKMKFKMNTMLTRGVPPKSYQQLKLLSEMDDNYKFYTRYYFDYYVKYPSQIPSNLLASAYDEIMKARMYDWLQVQKFSPQQVTKELERTGVAESNAQYIMQYRKMWVEEQQRLSQADTAFFLKSYVRND